MACRGVLFALTAEQLEAAKALPPGNDEALMAFVEGVERAWDEDWLQETDKAWDAIHRCLTDGTLEWGETAFHKCILGSRNLHQSDAYIVNLVLPADVVAVAAAISLIDETQLQIRYAAIDFATYADPPEADFEYTWDWFCGVQALYLKAAEADRAVLFTVDQ